MKKVAIIGHFGGGLDFYDGQTVKTKNLEGLLGKCSDITIKRVDTYYSRSNKFRLLWDTIKAMATCKYLFLLVSTNGMRVYLPLLYYLNKIFRKHIFHYVIGSELLAMIEQDKSLVKYLNALDANWFEYKSGTEFLQENGVNNAVTVPNFKNITPINEVTEYSCEKQSCSFCTFSRVMKEKGITDAIEAVARVNRDAGTRIATLDVYGPIDASYQVEFDRLLATYADCVEYKGLVDSQQSVDVLKDYYALLFPTYWAGEGMPGTIIDAYAAGLPIIASDWNANKAFVENQKHGLIYPSDEFQTLYDAICWSLQNTDRINRMRCECRAEFAKYMPETVLEIIRKAMDENQK